jgi:short-subunit dehydrogenase
MLKDKTILLTGATGGIGSEIARLLSSNGAHLILVDMQESLLESLAMELGAGLPYIKTIVADLSTSEGRKHVRTFMDEQYDSLDVLINCAGINVFSMFSDIDDDQIEKMISVNITSPILLTKNLIPLLSEADHGQIINFGSTFGSIGYPGFVTYSATKFAIRGFTEALRRELAKTKISVSYIAPRATRTNINTGPVNDMNDALGVKMDTPQIVAAHVVSILKSGRSSSRYLGWPEKLFVRINSLIPKLVDGALIKQLDIIKHYATLNRS